MIAAGACIRNSRTRFVVEPLFVVVCCHSLWSLGDEKQSGAERSTRLTFDGGPLELQRIELGKNGLDGVGFCQSPIVTGVGEDGDDSTRLDEIGGLSQGTTGRIRVCQDLFVTSREVAEIEHDSGNFVMGFAGDDLFEVSVVGVNQVDIGLVGGIESDRGAIEGRLLDVEGVDRSTWTNQVGQKQGVVTIARGGIDRDVADLKHFANRGLSLLGEW